MSLIESTNILDTCLICGKDIFLTDEYLKLLDCDHSYHRICMIHHLAQVTDKKFFMTDNEIKDKSNNLSVCLGCGEMGQGYREYVMYDVLKEKSQAFYRKMLERQDGEMMKGKE